MTARALTFARAYLRRWWHCRQCAHDSYTLRGLPGGRVAELGCFDCGKIFWARPR